MSSMLYLCACHMPRGHGASTAGSHATAGRMMETNLDGCNVAHPEEGSEAVMGRVYVQEDKNQVRRGEVASSGIRSV